MEILPRNVAINATLPRIDLRGDGVKEIKAWTADFPDPDGVELDFDPRGCKRMRVEPTDAPRIYRRICCRLFSCGS